MNDITALAQQLRATAEKANEHGEFNMAMHTVEVLALVESLEKAQQHEQEWKSLCEAAAVDLDDWREIDDRSRGLICKLADAVIAKSERIASLESRTVTVKLPKRSVGEVMHMSGFSRDYAEGWCSGNDNAIHEMRAAGINVEAD